MIDIAKDIDSNKIHKAVISKGNIKENITLKEAREFAYILFSKKKPDYVISTQKTFMKSTYHYPLYNRKDEHGLSELYMEHFPIIQNLETSVQVLGNGDGIYLTDGDSQKTSWKFDHSQLRMGTFAFMFGIDLVKKNKTSALLKALETE
ncbi:MAG: hypothetical protein GQ474_05910 [Sulfurimonas sp.]|nr:hypothetical protein [Sulfurimonas sp.]